MSPRKRSSQKPKKTSSSKKKFQKMKDKNWKMFDRSFDVVVDKIRFIRNGVKNGVE